MGNTAFGWVNAVDTAQQIIAGSEAASLPASNLASSRYGQIWRTNGTITTNVQIRFAAPTNVNVLALGSCSLGPADTVRHRLYDADGITVLYDTGEIACGVQPGYALHVNVPDQSYLASIWLCDFNAPSLASTGYFDIGRGWAGPLWRPYRGIILPWDEGWSDDAAVTRGKRSGGFFSGDGPQYRTMNVELDSIEEDEKIQASEMSRIAGVRKQVIHIPKLDGDIPREAIIGHFGKLSQITQSKATEPAVYGQTYNVIQDL